MSIVNKINWAMSLREPQLEALTYLDVISSKIDYKNCSREEAEQVAHESCEGNRKIKIDNDLNFPSFCFEMATGERVIIVMGAVCVIKSRVPGTLDKYISCIA